MTEGHGDDLYLYDKDRIRYNFSSNVTEPPRDIIDGLHRFIKENLDCIHHYPEPGARRVEKELARYHGIEPENVCVTNGATEAIYLIAMMLRGGRSYISEPTFSEYRDGCMMHGHRIADSFSEDVKAWWICNPNNPTGEVLPKNQIETLVHNHEDITFVLDQSYSEFTDQPLLSASEGCKSSNMVMVHSLTKHFAIPGLRIGYITGHKDVISRLKQLRMPWSVNALAQESALYLLKRQFPEGWFEEKIADAKVLRHRLMEIGIEVRPSDTHFLLCELPTGCASALKDWLAKEKGILIRDASNFKGLNVGHFRVASQGREADIELCDAVKEWLKLNKSS